MKTGNYGPHFGTTVCSMALAQGDDFALQWHQVGDRFGVDHDQVAGDTAPLPQAKTLSH